MPTQADEHSTTSPYAPGSESSSLFSTGSSWSSFSAGQASEQPRLPTSSRVCRAFLYQPLYRGQHAFCVWPSALGQVCGLCFPLNRPDPFMTDHNRIPGPSRLSNLYALVLKYPNLRPMDPECIWFRASTSTSSSGGDDTPAAWEESQHPAASYVPAQMLSPSRPQRTSS